MKLAELTAISPIDGRYRSKVADLDQYYSEYALIKYRVMVEVEYFIALVKHPLPQLSDVDHSVFPKLQDIYTNFSVDDAQKIKDTEAVTNHDVKAVEYFIKDEFDKLGLSAYKEFIHFGLTSQDINNTSIPCMLKDSIEKVFMPELQTVIDRLKELAEEWKDITLLARTHGQPASPTRVGKEIQVFIERLEKQQALLAQTKVPGKFGGATGNFNAHHIAYPNIDWKAFGNDLVNNVLGLERSQITTQIEHYDNLATIFDNIKRINNILVDFSRDIWTYVSMDYFKQKIKKGEVGSSAMPHKVNPIDFENAEGNLGIANAIFEHLAAKLPISRLQRDLTDSTVLRNVGVPMGHSVLSLKSLMRGLNKLLINPDKIAADLERNWPVVAEAIQTILRREGYPNPYEALRDLTRTNDVINQQSIARFIDTLNVSDSIKDELKQITPSNYTGVWF
ncbi:adenylosuccinate lyase [Bacteroidales bacterium]|nr:adenylosuccinate lyase [Bacteroidales bacterium]